MAMVCRRRWRGDLFFCFFATCLLQLHKLGRSRSGAEALSSCNCTSTLTTTVASFGCPVEQDVVFIAGVGSGVAGTSANGIAGIQSTAMMADFFATVLRQLPLPVLRAGVLTAEGSPREVAPILGDAASLRQRLQQMAAPTGEVLLAPALRLAALWLASGRANSEKVVFVSTDALPSDSGDFLQRAAELRGAGVRIVLLWIRIAVDDPMPLPFRGVVGADVLEIATYSRLAGVAVRVADTIRAPCSCPSGSQAVVSGLAGEEAIASSSRDIPHGATETQACSSHFSRNVAGDVVLTCSDGALRATSDCKPYCGAGNSVGIEVDGRSGVVVTALGLPVGGHEVQQCNSTIPGMSGLVNLTCDASGLVARHACEARCLPLASKRSNFVSWSGKAFEVELPSDGLDSGDWVSASCSAHFPGTSGDLLFGCLGGSLQALGDCRAPLPCSGFREAIDRVQAAAWTMFALGWLSFIIGVFALLRRCAQQRKQVDVVRTFVSLGCQGDEASPKKTTSSGQQTQPQLYVEVVRTGQCPLELVICIDTCISAETFEQVIAFVEQVIDELEMPPVTVSIIGFGHQCTVLARLSTQRDELLGAIAGMDRAAGDPCLAPALCAAADVLRAAGYPEDRTRRRAVVLIAGSNPCDMLDAVCQAEALHYNGVLMCIVQIGSAISPKEAQRLASQPSEDFVFGLDSCRSLPAVTDKLLSRIMEETLMVRRAKVAVNQQYFERMDDVSNASGCDCVIAGWEPQGSDEWTWNPQASSRRTFAEVTPWSSTLQAKPRQPITYAFPNALEVVPDSREEAMQTEFGPVDLHSATSQTDPVAKVVLAPWRQAPLDFLICVDTSIGSSGISTASADMPPEDYPTSAMDRREVTVSLRTVLEVIETILAEVQTPEVQIALTTFSDSCEVVCDFTADVGKLLTRLGTVQATQRPSAGSCLAPVLWRALASLSERPRQVRDAPALGPTAGIAKAVLLFMQHDAADAEEAEAASLALRELGVDVVVVKLSSIDGEIEWQLATLGSGNAPCIPSDFEVFKAPTRAVGEKLLGRVVRVLRRVVRARLAVPAAPLMLCGDVAAACVPDGSILVDVPDAFLESWGDGTLDDIAPFTEAELVKLVDQQKKAGSLRRRLMKLEDELQSARANTTWWGDELRKWALSDAQAIEKAQEAEFQALRLAESPPRADTVHEREAQVRIAMAKQRLQEAERRWLAATDRRKAAAVRQTEASAELQA